MTITRIGQDRTNRIDNFVNGVTDIDTEWTEWKPDDIDFLIKGEINSLCVSESTFQDRSL